MTVSSDRRRGQPDNGDLKSPPPDGEPRFDFSLVLLVVVVVAIVLFLTFELWIPHGLPNI